MLDRNTYSPICLLFFLAALLFFPNISFSQSAPCTPNTSACVATVRTGLCTWYAPANGIVDPDATCTTVGGAFSGEYWMEFTTAATTANIGVTVKQSTGGGSLPINNPAFQIFQRTGACSPGTYIPLSACNSTGSYNNNLGGGVNEAEEISVSGSTTYLIRVYDADRLMGCSGGGQNKEFILCMRETGQTGCASKRISSLPFDSGILNNTGFGNDNTAGCNAKSSAVNAAGEDYWFVYNSVGDQYVKLELIGTSAAVKVGVKVSKRGTNCNAASFPCYNTAVVRYFDGAINAAIGQTDAIPATIYLETSGDYYFIFDTDGIVTSNFQFKLSSFTPSGSDICSGALTIDPTSTPIPLFNDYDYTGDAIAASSSQPGKLNNNVMRDGCGYATENTKWLTFTTNGAGDVTLNFTSISCINADNGFVPQLQLVTIHNAAFDANCTSAWIQDGSCFNTATDFSYTPVTAPPAGRTYFVMIDGNAGAHCTFDISASNTVPAASNTITTSAIAPTTYCAGSAVSVPYTITGSYNPANVFTAQLSNSAGSFAAPTGIGTLASQVAGTISATIPPGTSSGSGYRIRVVSSDPAVTGSDNGADITINALPTITLGSNPSVCSGTTSANLTYSATTGTPDQYSIDYDAAAVAQGFVDVVNAALPASPIVLTVPGAAAAGTYNYTVTVRNSSTGCVSSGTAKTVIISGCTDPVICSGATSANLPYTSTTGSPDQYSIDYDATAEGQGFVDVTNAALPASPIVLTVPGGATPGIYNYTVTVRNSTTSCVSSSTAKTVTINALPTITLGANPTVCSGSTTANLTYSATTASPNQYSIDYDATAEGQGFVDVTNAALPASPIVLTVPGAAVAGTYNYTVTVRNSSTGCVSSGTAKTLTIPANGGAGTWTWVGAISTSWFDPCNWDKKSLPDLSSDVTIPGGTVNDPTITGAAANCKTITIDIGNGGVVNLNSTAGGVLNVAQ